MKANELMVGDWIYVVDNEFDLKAPFQVKQIDVLGNIYGFIPDYDGEPVDGDISIECCEPISLTPEILEKNGFESNTNMFGFADYELSKDYILENRGDRFCISRRVNNSGSTYWILTIFFVHQLQHFLRLCGIDKEIVL